MRERPGSKSSFVGWSFPQLRLSSVYGHVTGATFASQSHLSEIAVAVRQKRDAPASQTSQGTARVTDLEWAFSHFRLFPAQGGRLQLV
jgi:hypothetical protein